MAENNANTQDGSQSELSRFFPNLGMSGPPTHMAGPFMNQGIHPMHPQQPPMQMHPNGGMVPFPGTLPPGYSQRSPAPEAMIPPPFLHPRMSPGLPMMTANFPHALATAGGPRPSGDSNPISRFFPGLSQQHQLQQPQQPYQNQPAPMTPQSPLPSSHPHMFSPAQSNTPSPNAQPQASPIIKTLSRSLSATSQKPAPVAEPGVYLNGKDIIYNLEENSSKQAKRQLESVPLTRYNSEYLYHLGSHIAVNKTCVCYAVRGGMIRVISTTTGLLDLLRGHEKVISDLQFFSEDSDLLASTAKDGHIFIWRILKPAPPPDPPAGSIPEKTETKFHECLYAIKSAITDNEQTYFRRIVWHPKDDSVLASSNHEGLYIWQPNLTSEVDNLPVVKTAEELQPISFLTPGDQINNFAFSPNGETIAIGTMNGLIYVWDWKANYKIHEFSPHNQPVFGVVFCGTQRAKTPLAPGLDSLFITGGLRNSEVKLWETKTWSCLQTLTLESNEGEKTFYNHLGVDSTANFLFITSAKQNNMFIAHIKPPKMIQKEDASEFDYSTCQLDYITEFALTQPILSFALRSRIRSQRRKDDVQIRVSKPILEMQVYCVQTKAIQILHVRGEQCYPVLDDAPSPFFSVAPLTRTSSENVIAETKTDLSKSFEKTNGASTGPPEAITGEQQQEPSELTQEQQKQDEIQDRQEESQEQQDQQDQQVVQQEQQEQQKEQAHDQENEVHEQEKQAQVQDQEIKEEKESQQIQAEEVSVANEQKEPEQIEEEKPQENQKFAESFDSEQQEEISGGESEPGLVPPSDENETDETAEPSGNQVDTTSINQTNKEDEKIAVNDATLESPQLVGENATKEDDGGAQIEDSSIKEEQTELSSSKEKAKNKGQTGVNKQRTDRRKKTDNATSSTPSSAQWTILPRPKDSTELVPASPSKVQLPSTASPNPSTEALQMNKKVKTPSRQVSSPTTPILNSLSAPSISESPSPNFEGQVTWKEMKKLEALITSRTERVVQQQLDRHYMRIEKERAEREKIESQRQEKLVQAIGQAISTSIGSTIEKTVHKELQQYVIPQLRTIILGTIDTTLSKAVQDNIKKGLQSVVPKLDVSKEALERAIPKQQIANDIISSVKAPVHEAFKQTFQSQLIPAFEASCQKMFEQINDAFQKGVQEQLHDLEHRTKSITLSNGVPSGNPTDNLKSAVDALISVSEHMSRSIVETQNKILHDFGDRGAGSSNGLPFRSGDSVHLPLNASRGSYDLMNELQRYLQNEQFDEAFHRVLSTANLDMVVWLCSQLDPIRLFSFKPFPLRQFILLSLIQQLGYDLSRDTNLKLNWLKEAVINLNTNDGELYPSIVAVLSQLQRNCEDIQPQFFHQSGTIPSALKTLILVVNSLLAPLHMRSLA